MEMNTEIEMNSTPNSTPANSPIPNPQGESPCMARRKFAMEMEVLNIKILSQSNLLGKIQRYSQYEDTELYQIEKKRTQDHGKKKRPNAITNAPRPQMAPPKASETEVYAQSEARFHRKTPQNNPPQYNRQGNKLAQPSDLLFILADLLNKFPGLAQQLPRIAAVKNNRNQKYSMLRAF
ncbi:hypothetical protein NPIL_504151 [Nephila pilipes]|uniref:Uncharacterized protein n=1 Tax=Nephila pilipes TaxID=299642 RepID=A0A8X6R517_NEPPI|nr:hypothetical protein NPIL_504151 [Nephila pilipes]